MDEPTLLNSRYKIEERVGTGGMADVFRARDLMLERTVAIKVLRQDLSSASTFRERFRQEARAAANLSHPSIVTIHDFGLDSGKLFLVMEYITGNDIKSILHHQGRFQIDDALPLLIQACAGLGYAHRAGLIHCDVKPHNLIVTSDSHLKITDFGIARALTSYQPDTPENVVWGSPQYFSPEQASGLTLTPATDVYSLGVVMYEMLTGRLPFEATTSAELSRLHRTAAPPLPREYNPDIPPALEAIMLKLLAKEPSARYRTADQLGRVLMIVNQPSPSASQRLPSGSHRRWFFRPAANTHLSPTNGLPPSQPELQKTSHSTPLDIDWVTWLVALLALIAVGGLIPLWVWVYLLYFSNNP